MRKLSQGDDKNLSQSCPDHVEQSWDLNLDALSFRLCSSSYALGLPCAYCIEQTHALGPFLPKQDGVVKSTHENKKKNGYSLCWILKHKLQKCLELQQLL